MARTKGSTTRPQFYTYTNEKDRKSFVVWMKKNYKTSKDLTKWYGDQLFGKAVQPIGNDDGKPLIVKFDSVFDATPPKTEGNR